MRSREYLSYKCYIPWRSLRKNNNNFKPYVTYRIDKWNHKHEWYKPWHMNIKALDEFGGSHLHVNSLNPREFSK